MRRKWLFIWLASALLTAALARILPEFALLLKARVTRPLTRLIGALSALLPFPAAGLFAALTLLLPGAALLSFRYRPVARLLAVLLCACLTGYILLWDVLYACPALPSQALSEPSLSILCERLITQAEESLPESLAADRDALPDAALGLMRACTEQSLQTARWTRFPALFSRLGIAGLYFPLTGEALVNGDDLPDTLPFTICHELAHQAGWAREDEANYAAFLACESCDAPAFRYSAHFTMLLYAMKTLRRVDEYRWHECVNRMNPALLSRFAAANGLNATPSTGLRAIQETLTDAFLRVSGDPGGIDSYERVIQLIAAHWQV